MATQLTIVNNILERLREDTVGSVADNAYSKLIARFVNDAKADLEDVNYEWSVYVTEIDFTILADSSTVLYTATGTNERSWLMRSYASDIQPAAYDITANEVALLCDIPHKILKREQAVGSNDTTLTNKYPRLFAVKNNATGTGWELEIVDPVGSGDSARTWRTYWYVPQADLALDGTADATVILLPSRPIEMQAIFYALNERGEEMGEPGGVASSRAQGSIAAALENDMQVQKKSDEIDIKRNEYI
jgi:hypothetical protein